ncbi:hypothetical protein [Bdellovibrio sp. HCB337]|uniref:hypothetical protein n=1 Tax=Bdellovibrio sp. HCB337 TaxID=3394358 RepID=UPI0039A5DDF5
MNYRILILTAMLAVTLQACQGSKGRNEKKARSNNTTAGGANKTNADGTPISGKSALDLKGECTNPIAMTVQAGEKEIKMEDLVSGKDGSYQLIATEYFAALENSKGEANNIHFLGSEITNDENIKEATTSEDKIEVLCATEAKEGEDLNLSGNLDIPNAFDTKDGSVRFYRHDDVKIVNGKATLASVIAPKTAKIQDGKGEKKPQGLKILLVQKDNSDITLKMQYDSVDRQQKNMSIIMSATYSLKK